MLAVIPILLETVNALYAVTVLVPLEVGESVEIGTGSLVRPEVGAVETITGPGFTAVGDGAGATVVGAKVDPAPFTKDSVAVGLAVGDAGPEIGAWEGAAGAVGKGVVGLKMLPYEVGFSVGAGTGVVGLNKLPSTEVGFVVGAAGTGVVGLNKLPNTEVGFAVGDNDTGDALGLPGDPVGPAVVGEKDMGDAEGAPVTFGFVSSIGEAADGANVDGAAEVGEAEVGAVVGLAVVGKALGLPGCTVG